MSTWDDKPNDYEHAMVVIAELRAELTKGRMMTTAKEKIEAMREEALAWVKDDQEKIAELRAENKRLRLYIKDLQINSPAQAVINENERLRARVSELVKLLDDQLGTPCEQIRHQQEVERLQIIVDGDGREIARLHSFIHELRRQLADQGKG